jgi:hypothetical protein
MPLIRLVMMGLRGLAGLFALLFSYDPNVRDAAGLHGGGLGNPFRWLMGTAVAIFGVIAAIGDVVQSYVGWWTYSVPATALYVVLIQLGIWWPDEQDPMPESRWPLGLDRVLIGFLVTVVVLILTIAVAGLVWLPIKYLIPQWHDIVATFIFMFVVFGGYFLWTWIFPSARDRKARDRNRAKKNEKRRKGVVVGGDN